MALKKTRDVSDLRGIVERDYPRTQEGMIAQLADADPAVRRWGARDLAEHPLAGARLCRQLLTEEDASVRAALFTSAARIGGADVVDGALPLLRSEDPALRNGAIELLAALPQDVAPRIETLLHDSDSDVRIFTINLLGVLAHAKVPVWLAHILRSETEKNVIGAALEVLSEVGGPDMLEPLREIRERFGDDAFIVFAVDIAMERAAAS